MRVLYPVELEFGVFLWREENQRTLRTQRKTLRARTRTKNKLDPHDTRPELNPGHIGGRRALSSLLPQSVK